MRKLITLSHGNGGQYMRQLIDDVFFKYLNNDLLNTHTDAALLPEPEHNNPMMTTVDGFTVQPIFFPGGNIGSLCVHGTVNDLAVSGAIAKYLTLGVILEEGLPFDSLEKIVKSLAQTANECGVKVVCGDTKVVPRGQGSEVYFTTTGIGYKASKVDYSTERIKAGDKILISGSIGDHGAAIMLAREQFGLSAHLQSDSVSVMPLCQAIYERPEIHFLRDPTRGGIAGVFHEIIQATGLGIQLSECNIPIADEVKVICEMLGYEPYYLANEGRVVAVVDAAVAEQVCSIWKMQPGGERCAIIGEITNKHQELVMQTPAGGERLLFELTDDPLPRIC